MQTKTERHIYIERDRETEIEQVRHTLKEIEGQKETTKTERGNIYRNIERQKETDMYRNLERQKETDRQIDI